MEEYVSEVFIVWNQLAQGRRTRRMFCVFTGECLHSTTSSLFILPDLLLFWSPTFCDFFSQVSLQHTNFLFTHTHLEYFSLRILSSSAHRSSIFQHTDQFSILSELLSSHTCNLSTNFLNRSDTVFKFFKFLKFSAFCATHGFFVHEPGVRLEPLSSQNYSRSLNRCLPSLCNNLKASLNNLSTRPHSIITELLSDQFRNSHGSSE